ncbi:suppressor of lurcher protein 1 isoform X1 [Drosophila gunungcola]|uniref:suppressor of lurcher protein 1 isoform X1 n=1 Tax=Drosophila gunungcola TaxID=103775 RepID=UPI0022E1BA7A|nr:suppressor of lurcher protein 1 isoform X1 [Drosophila gunungcola]
MESGFTVSLWPLTMAAATLSLALALGLSVALMATGNGQLQQQVANSKQSHLWLDCSCLHLNERNATQWGRLAINASQALGAKNNCLMVFIAGMDDELVAFRLEQLQLRPGCLDSVDVFPFLREPVIENATLAADTFCQHSRNRSATPIYSAGRLLGLRLRFQQPPTDLANSSWNLTLNASYRFLKRENFRTDGRLVPHSFCDFYFFASLSGEEGSLGQGYFHSPQFPAHYPAHIKCAYKFIGRPDTHVELLFEELQLPPVVSGGCQLDALTLFDTESAHMSTVIDVLCSTRPTRRLVSSGPDLLLEFNASSNRTAKGFRGKYKFVSNEPGMPEATPPPPAVLEAASVAVMPEKLQQQQAVAAKANGLPTDAELSKPGRSFEQCKQTFDSRVNKSGTFDSNQLLLAKHALGGVLIGGSRVLQCRYEFEAQPPERIQIRFHDFNVPTEHENSTACQPGDALHVVTEVRGRYETQELLCGAFLPKPLMSNGARLQLQFVGKYPPAMTNKVQYYGFRAEYRFLTNFGIMSGVQQEDCSFVYNSSERISGLFHSPNFPGYYLENVVCNYYFYGASDERVVLHFTYFDVEGIGSCDHQTASDFIEFSNFMSTDRKFSRYCGRLPDFEMRSDGRFFRVTLHSNDRFVAIGFRALYTFEAIPVNNSIADLRDNASMQSFVSSALSLPATNLYKLIFYIMFMYI